MATKNFSISIIGSGNVAWHLGNAFRRKKLNINQIYARNTETGGQLAQKLKCGLVSRIEELDEHADIFILALPDSSIEEIMKQWPEKLKNAFCVHTSGSVGLQSLSEHLPKCGVFYPLQTLNHNEKVKFKNIPICIEAADHFHLEILRDLASLLSRDVRELNSEQRRIAHLSAVFASNFTNFMYAIAADILKNHGMDFDIIKPLIKKTAGKHKKNDNPFRLQTGPAVREDMETISKHLELLKIRPDFREIYQLISETIVKHKQEESR